MTKRIARIFESRTINTSNRTATLSYPSAAHTILTECTQASGLVTVENLAAIIFMLGLFCGSLLNHFEWKQSLGRLFRNAWNSFPGIHRIRPIWWTKLVLKFRFGEKKYKFRSKAYWACFYTVLEYTFNWNKLFHNQNKLVWKISSVSSIPKKTLKDKTIYSCYRRYQKPVLYGTRSKKHSITWINMYKLI